MNNKHLRWPKRLRVSQSYLLAPPPWNFSLTLCNCFALNVCILPKFTCWSYDELQCDVILRWSFWEEIRVRWGSEGGALMMELVSWNVDLAIWYAGYFFAASQRWKGTPCSFYFRCWGGRDEVTASPTSLRDDFVRCILGCQTRVQSKRRIWER